MKKLALLLALMATATAQAEIYRWVDENGVTVYSEMPPPDGEADRVKTAPAPSETPEAMQQQQEAEMQKLEDYREDKELAAEKKQQGQLSKQIDEENCRNAKDNLDKLIAAAKRLVRMPDGNYVRLTEEQRQKHMEEARKIIDEYCK
jgi:hypothetical protein